MPSAVIVDAIRTPITRRNGALAGWHPTDLAAVALRALFDRNDIDPAVVDDVIMGCVIPVGEQGGNVARLSWLAGGLPESVPATTVDRQCGSSMQATHFAAQGVMAGVYDVVVAGGVESMSRLPMGSNMPDGTGTPMGVGLTGRYGQTAGILDQGVSAELCARKWNITRDDLDDLGFESHRRALQAQSEGRFDREIVPVAGEGPDGEFVISADSGPRPGIDRQAMGSLKPAFREDGVLTAGNSSQISDGASAMLIMSEERASQLGLTPRARFTGFALAAESPVEMFTAPIPATRKVLDRAGLTIDDIDLVEINEAFAIMPIGWSRSLGANLDRVNVNGGAIALGHPLGATGARMTATLLCELERTGGRYGLQTICEGGGLANATVIERLG